MTYTEKLKADASKNAIPANQLFTNASNQALQKKLISFYEEADVSDHLEVHHELINSLLSPEHGIKKKKAKHIICLLQKQILFISSLKEHLSQQIHLSNLKNQ